MGKKEKLSLVNLDVTRLRTAFSTETAALIFGASNVIVNQESSKYGHLFFGNPVDDAGCKEGELNSSIQNLIPQLNIPGLGS